MRTGARPCALDTNVIVRFVTQDHPSLSPKADEIMRAISEDRLAVVLDPVVLAEVVFVLTSFYKLSNESVSEALKSLVIADNVLMDAKAKYLLALDIFGTANVHFGDACACAAAVQDCGGRLISFDRILSRVPGISRLEEPL